MDSDQSAERLKDLTERAARQRRRFYARQPRKISDVVAQVIAKKGYGASKSNEKLQNVWAEIAGAALAKFSRPTGVRQGKLEVIVANSLMMQELGFETRRLLAAIKQALPEARIEGIRYRVGKIDNR